MHVDPPPRRSTRTRTSSCARSSSARLPTRKRPAGSHPPSFRRLAVVVGNDLRADADGAVGRDLVQPARAGDQELAVARADHRTHRLGKLEHAVLGDHASASSVPMCTAPR